MLPAPDTEGLGSKVEIQIIVCRASHLWISSVKYRVTMYRLFREPSRKPVSKASPDVAIAEPKFSKLVIFLVKCLTRLYLYIFYGVAKVALHNEMILFDAFERALAGKSRCIIAFRHPNGGEPQLIGWFFLVKLRRLAAKKGIRFTRFPHTIFVYSYEVARWGGRVSRFIMPNVLALPVYHAKVDRQGMTRISKAIEDGLFPVSISPEGQVSYTTETVPRLEPGVVRIGFHAAERLAAKDANIPVEILPLSIYIRFGSWGKLTAEHLMRKVEQACGIKLHGRRKLPFLQRLEQCRNHILAVNEERYQIQADTSLSFEERLDAVIYAALETAERMLGVKSEGDFFVRKNRVHQLCWDKIVLPGVDSLKNTSRVQRRAKDLQAGEAWYIGRHQELADLGWYFRVPLPAEDAQLHQKIEYLQNLWDFANRTMGGSYPDRVNIFPRKMVIQSAPPINLINKLPVYRESKKATIAAVLSELEQAFIDSIHEQQIVNNKGT